MPAVFLLVFGGLMTYRIVQMRRAPRRLFAALRRAAEGARDEADSEMEALTNSQVPVVKATAFLHLSDSAERRASFAEALVRCDRGLEAAASTQVARAQASIAVIPTLVAERAVILAALGREAEAGAEMAHLAEAFPSYALRAWAERRFQLVTRARSGDLGGAADAAASDACDAPMAAREDLLGDLARAAARPEAAGAEEVARLQRVLREDAEARRWIEAISPGVLAAFAARGRGGAEGEAEAEREAQAEAEAEAADHAAEAQR